MRRAYRTFAAIALCVLLLSCSASAHSGKTDSNGGHYDSFTGEYHYHHGHPAHQHTNGVCPYNFDDQTGTHSGTSGGSRAAKSGGSSKSATDNNGVISEKAEKIILTIVLVIFLSPMAFWVIYCIFDGIKYMVLKIKYTPKYRGIDPIKCVSVPPGTEIGDDGLPKESGADGWGETYTVYTTKYGKCYHKNPKCVALCEKDHICNVRAKMTPCKKCCDSVPDLEWYDKYAEIKYIKQTYNIK